MPGPQTARSLGLLEPAVVDYQVEPAVAVDVAHAGAVVKLFPLARLGQRVKRPRLAGFLPIGLEPTPATLPVTDELRPPIAVEIDQCRRLALHAFEGIVFLPSGPVRARV